MTLPHFKLRLHPTKLTFTSKPIPAPALPISVRNQLSSRCYWGLQALLLSSMSPLLSGTILCPAWPGPCCFWQHVLLCSRSSLCRRTLASLLSLGSRNIPTSTVNPLLEHFPQVSTWSYFPVPLSEFKACWLCSCVHLELSWPNHSFITLFCDVITSSPACRLYPSLLCVDFPHNNTDDFVKM